LDGKKTSLVFRIGWFSTRTKWTFWFFKGLDVFGLDLDFGLSSTGIGWFVHTKIDSIRTLLICCSAKSPIFWGEMVKKGVDHFAEKLDN
jgi:hypothetical protein